MSDPRTTLKEAIATTLEGIKHLSVDDAADLIAELADEDEDMVNGAILDGIRWGYTAAVSVEMAGGAMLRVTLPGGVGITHQWDNAGEASDQIEAALYALVKDR